MQNAQSALEVAEEESEVEKACPSFSGEPFQVHTKLGRPWGNECSPTRLPEVLG